jgi:hypothetical protein
MDNICGFCSDSGGLGGPILNFSTFQLGVSGSRKPSRRRPRTSARAETLNYARSRGAQRGYARSAERVRAERREVTRGARTCAEIRSYAHTREIGGGSAGKLRIFCVTFGSASQLLAGEARDDLGPRTSDPLKTWDPGWGLLEPTGASLSPLGPLSPLTSPAPQPGPLSLAEPTKPTKPTDLAGASLSPLGPP